MLACGAATLVVKPKYHEFFSRGLRESVHYVTISPPWEAPLCPSLKASYNFLDLNNKEQHCCYRENIRAALSRDSLSLVYCGLPCFRGMCIESAE